MVYQMVIHRGLDRPRNYGRRKVPQIILIPSRSTVIISTSAGNPTQSGCTEPGGRTINIGIMPVVARSAITGLVNHRCSQRQWRRLRSRCLIHNWPELVNTSISSGVIVGIVDLGCCIHRVDQHNGGAVNWLGKGPSRNVIDKIAFFLGCIRNS